MAVNICKFDHSAAAAESWIKEKATTRFLATTFFLYACKSFRILNTVQTKKMGVQMILNDYLQLVVEALLRWQFTSKAFEGHTERPVPLKVQLPLKSMAIWVVHSWSYFVFDMLSDDKSDGRYFTCFSASWNVNNFYSRTLLFFTFPCLVCSCFALRSSRLIFRFVFLEHCFAFVAWYCENCSASLCLWCSKHQLKKINGTTALSLIQRSQTREDKTTNLILIRKAEGLFQISHTKIYL